MSIPFEVELPQSNTPPPSTEPLPPEPPPPSPPEVEMQVTHHPTPEAPPVFSVSQLTKKIRMLLEGPLRSITVEGEISNFKASAQGHLYFNLKDKQSQIRGIMFRHAASKVRFDIGDGLEVVAKGNITVYEPRGEYQIQVTSMEPKGIGALQLAFEQLKAKLAQEGLFDQQHKRRISFLPRRIGIITSPTGAVIHDMLTVLGRRFPGIPVLIYPAPVQGQGAAAKIVEGIQYLNNLPEDQQLDVLIVGRGGGSMEDLWEFNDEALARTLFHSRLPVISAVGHETDFTIADFVSDLRAPTPSAAMELCTPRRQDLLNTLQNWSHRLYTRIQQSIELLQERTSALSKQLQTPEFVIHQHQQHIDELNSRLQQHTQFLLQSQQQHLNLLNEKLVWFNPQKNLSTVQQQIRGYEESLKQHFTRHLEQAKSQLALQVNLLNSMSPLNVMSRGYSIAFDDQQRVVDSIQDIQPQDAITLQLKDGALQTQVIEVAGTKKAK